MRRNWSISNVLQLISLGTFIFKCLDVFVTYMASTFQQLSTSMQLWNVLKKWEKLGDQNLPPWVFTTRWLSFIMHWVTIRRPRSITNVHCLFSWVSVFPMMFTWRILTITWERYFTPWVTISRLRSIMTAPCPFNWVSLLLITLASQILTIAWVLYISPWVTISRQRSCMNVLCLFDWISLDSIMLSSQVLTATWVFYSSMLLVTISTLRSVLKAPYLFS